MAEDREKKAKRATFAIRQALSTSVNVSVKLAMSLYEKQIEPILLYSCPIWAIPDSNCSVRVSCENLDESNVKMEVENMF